MRFDYHTNDVPCPHSPVNDDRGFGCNGSLGIAAELGALALLSSRSGGLGGLFPSCPNELELLKQKAKECKDQIQVSEIGKFIGDKGNDIYKSINNQLLSQKQPISDMYELTSENGKTKIRVDKYGNSSVTEIKDEVGTIICSITEPNTNELQKQDDMSSYIKFNGDALPNTGFADFDDLWWYAYVAWSSDNNFGFGDYRTSVVLSKNIAFNKEQYNCDGDIGFYIKLKTIFKTQTFKPKENDRSKLHGIIALQSDIEEFNKKYPSKIHDKLLFQFLLDMTTDNEYGIFPEVDPEKVKNIVDSIINS